MVSPWEVEFRRARPSPNARGKEAPGSVERGSTLGKGNAEQAFAAAIQGSQGAQGPSLFLDEPLPTKCSVRDWVVR